MNVSRLAPALVVLFLTLACGSRTREYQLEGQVLAIDAGRQEITIRHRDIVGFMPGMTMPFRVRDAQLLDGRKPGDLVRATLVVLESDAYLAAIESTGWAPVALGGPLPAVEPEIEPLAPGQMVPDQTFLTQDARTESLVDWRGSAVALTFIYTRCPYPTFCPLMDRQFGVIQQRVAADPALAGRVRLVSVSFDPDYDTPEVLRAHATRRGTDPAIWRFVTADREAIDRFGALFGLTVARNRADPLDITHSLRTVVIDPDGRLVAVHPGNDWTPDDLLRDLRHATADR